MKLGQVLTSAHGKIREVQESPSFKGGRGEDRDSTSLQGTISPAVPSSRQQRKARPAAVFILQLTSQYREQRLAGKQRVWPRAFTVLCSKSEVVQVQVSNQVRTDSGGLAVHEAWL